MTLWLNSKFVTKNDFSVQMARIDAKLDTSKAERDSRYDLVKERLADHDTRIKMVEVDVAKPPSRHELRNLISTMQGAVMSVERAVADMSSRIDSQGADTRRQMDTFGTYLHTIIDKHVR